VRAQGRGKSSVNEGALGAERYEFAGLFLTHDGEKESWPAPSPNILDYPDSMSLYERESLAAEAKLAAERKIKKRPKPSSNSK
jgi:hypothetical protein